MKIQRVKKTPEVERRFDEIKTDHRAIERVLRSIADEARNKKSYKHALICDLDDGCTVAVAGIHHQTLQAEQGVRYCGHGSGLYKERLSNAELILNAPDLYRYARRLKMLLDALYVEAFARDGNDSTRLDNIAASLKKIVNEYPLFQISDYLFDLDAEGNMDKKALTVPLAHHRGLK